MAKHIVGWDVGGAHLKAAWVDDQGMLVSVLQTACPLWLGIEQLHAAVRRLLAQLPPNADLHAITMTGELVDGFDSREQGVHAIIAAMQAELAGAPLRIYAGRAGYLTADQVDGSQIMNIASANWFASARLASTMVRECLFIDIGSTTTDLLLLVDGQIDHLGYSDYERLVSGELLYTGIVRTAVMAVAQSAQFKGRDMGLMAEYFATMADVYRLTGDLNEAHDQSDSADGAEKTVLASARRLSRMTGYEFAVDEMPLWLEFADHLKQRQKQRILQACSRQLERLNRRARALIGAGIGRFLVRELAAELDLPYCDFNQLLPMAKNHGQHDAGDCAPAVAVAVLASAVGE